MLAILQFGAKQQQQLALGQARGSNMNSLLPRNFSTTKGHKRTRRLRAQALFLRKNAPPKELPWYLHKQVHPEVKAMLTDYDNLYRMAEITELMFELIMSKPDLSPMEERLDEIKRRIMETERARFHRANFPQMAESVLHELGLPVPNSKKLLASDQPEEVKRALVEVLSAPSPALRMLPSNLNQESTATATSSALASVKLPEQSLEKVQMRAEDLQLKINEKVNIAWLQEVKSHKTESAASLQRIYDAKKELGLIPHVSIGVRMVNAYLREGDVDRAYATFNAFHKYEHQSLDLYIAGMRVMEHKRNPTRAMSLFDQAEDVFPRGDLPYLYHATMRATKVVRQATWNTFDLYNRMTKVDRLKPTTETLCIVLETCAVLGDVERAKLMWHEMVENYGVVPDEYAHCSFLNTIARGNRMLRAKALKAGSVKVLTFEDKALLANCGGFINAPIKFTDEVQDVLSELQGHTRDPTNYQSDYDRYRQLREEAEEYEDEEEEFEMEEEKPEPASPPPPTPPPNAEAAVKPPPPTKRDTFLEPGETEEDFLGEDDEEEIQAKLDAEAEAEAKREAEDGVHASKIQGNEHCIFIPGLSPETPLPKTSALSVKSTYAKLIELNQTSPPPSASASAMATTSTSSALAVDQPITGTTNGERQEANIQLANKILGDIVTKYEQPITTEILNAHMKVFASALRLHRASECLALYETHGVRKDLYTYNTLISMYCRAQRLNKAFEVFELVQQQPGITINRMTVGPLIDALARNGRVDEAFDMYLEYKNMNLLEKHIRYVRNKLRLAQDPRVGEFPDPNYWRSAENMSTQLHKLSRSKEGMFKQQWIQSIIRS